MNHIKLIFKITDVKKYSKSIEEYELDPDEARSEISLQSRDSRSTQSKPKINWFE